MTAGTTNFPGALDSHTGASPLGMGEVNNQANTLATASHTNSVTTVTVASTSLFPSKGYILVKRELISYTGTTATTFTGCTRGVGGTTATAFLSGAVVEQVVTAANHNDMAAAIVAVETKIGAGAGTIATTLLATTTLSVSAATLDFTSIASTYTHLLLIVTARSTVAYTTDNLLMRVGNGSFDAGGNYDYQQTYSVSTTLTGNGAAASTYWQIGQLPGSTAPSNVFSRATIWIPHYATSAMQREYISESTSRHGTAGTDFYRSACGDGWRSTSAIDRVRLLPGGGGASLEAGTVAQLYGVR
jgi:hypothetical protein